MRYLVILLIAAVGVAYGINVTARNLQTVQVAEVRAVESHTVEPGETLWGIARLHYQGDPRSIVHQIRELNNIGPIIVPGQTIYLP